MEKRAITAFILIFIVIWFSNEFIWKPAYIPPESASDSLRVDTDTTGGFSRPEHPDSERSTASNRPPDSITTVETPNPAIAAVSADTLETAPPAPVQTVIIDTELYRAKFTTEQAGLISWKLKKHFNTQLPEDLPEEERWLELIPQDRRGALQLGFFELNDLPASEIYNLMDATWFVDRTGVIEVTNTPQTVVFTLNRFGLQLTKTLTFYPGQYSFDLGVDLQGISSDEWEYYEITWHPGMNSTEKNYKDDTNFFAGISNVGNRINTKMLRKIQKQEKIVIGDQHRAQDEVIWSGLKTKYFTAVVIPEEPGVEVRFGGSKMNAHYIDFELVVPAYVSTFRVYVGPIDFDGLKAEGHQLEKLLDLGKYIGFISRPMLELFLFLHQFIPNYGIIIILFSIMMKTVFYPFNKSSYTSMRKMQEIQPKMKELQEKYKNNPQQLQKEMMELYKEHGVNPLSGCLPMLPQIPIFFALFRVLRATVELRSAGFIPIWLEDLSQPDPFYALPIMMGITMFIQQKTSPQSAAAATNPQQKMMMYILPFVMTFMFLNFQAGLVLYWFTNNILTVIQQYMITHSHTKSQQA